MVGEIVSTLKSNKNILILCGSLSDQIGWDGKKLIDYVVEIAHKLDAPIGATGNSINALRDKDVTAKKMYAAEIPAYMKWGWDEPLLGDKPELLVFIGYDPDVEKALISTLYGLDVKTVVLDNKYMSGATLSLPDLDPNSWKLNLEEIINKL